MKRKERLWPALLYLFRVNRRYLPWLIIMLVVTAVDSAGQVAMGWVFKRFVDSTIARDTGVFGHYLLLLAGLLVLAMGVSALARLAGGKYANICRRYMRELMGKKLARIPMPWLEKQRTGDLLAMLGNDLVQIGNFFENELRMFFGEWLRFGLSLAYMIVLNPWLTLITVAFIPLGGLLMALTSKPVQRLTTEQNNAVGSVISVVQDSVSGQGEVKAFGMQEWLGERFIAKLNQWLQLARKGFNAQAGIDSVSVVNLIVPFGALLVTGLWMALHGQITAGGLLAFLMVSNGIVNPIMALNWRIGELRRAAGCSTRVMEVLQADEERADGDDLPLRQDAPLLSFRGIGFAYDREGQDGVTARQQIFSDLSLDIRRGETVAVVGQSGSGKSTLLKLAAGFYEPEAGQVSFGGHPLAHWNLSALRNHLSMVDQDTYLFPGSIGENIACGTFSSGSPAMVEQVEGAARQARLEDFIQTLQDGLETPAGERGARLSGGQRQRVAIARSMLRGAELLLLDEPTSALDAATEKEIQAELRELVKGRTALIVTHRLSMAVFADRIVVLDGGAVVEQGTHGELMERQGRYWALYQQQAENGGEAA